MPRASPSPWGWVRHFRCGTDTGSDSAIRVTCRAPCSGTPLTSTPTTTPTGPTTTAGTIGGIPTAIPALGITTRIRAIRPGDSTSPWASGSASAGDTTMIRGGVAVGVGMDGRAAGRTPAGTITGGTTTGRMARRTTTPGALVSPTSTGATATGMPRPDTGPRSIRVLDTRSPPEAVRRWPAPNRGPNPLAQRLPRHPGAPGVQCRPRLDPGIVQVRGAARAHPGSA